uniref:Cell surface glycoprotein MUC18-like n=1 Tax=Petromyzon marinus TaxID=7757 RepID=A0AAJ7UD57_PETMA|nr:cell surface glycoprotein MUC18-like [Petromyzon marinus]
MLSLEGEEEGGEEVDEEVLKEELQTGMEPSWVLESASQGDSGRYLCSGFDLDFPDLPRHHATISLLVHYLEDVWLSPVGPLTVLRGQDRVALLLHQGVGSIEYTWWKVGNLTPIDVVVDIAPDDIHQRAPWAPAAVRGATSCTWPTRSWPTRASTGGNATVPSVPAALRSATIKVSVEDKPSIVALDTVVLSSVDQQLVLSCQAHGPPSPILTWNILTVPQEQAFANGSVRSSVEVIVTSELKSRGVACVATNAHGESEHRFFFSTADPTPIAATAAPQNSSSYLLPVVVALVVTVVLVSLLLLGAYYWYRRQRSGSSNIDSKANSGQRVRPSGVEEKKPLQDRSPDV